jgi:hypothetical protein
MYVCPPSSCLELQIVKCRFFVRTEQYLVKLFLPVIGGKYQNTTYFHFSLEYKEKNVAPVTKIIVIGIVSCSKICVLHHLVFNDHQIQDALIHYG